MAYRLAKRTLDIVVASLLLVASAPALLIAMALVRRELGRPVLFAQQRPGQYARPFTCWKLRTMREAQDSHGQPLPDVERLTSLGRRLRRLSIDELPQLWNVLRGEMSLVGPRPLLMQYLPLYDAFQARRHEVPPGITGWAQINGRNAQSWQERFALDVWYVDHRRFGLDLRILLLTLARAFDGGGVSAANHATMPAFRGNNAAVEDSAARNEHSV